MYTVRQIQVDRHFSITYILALIIHINNTKWGLVGKWEAPFGPLELEQKYINVFFSVCHSWNDLHSVSDFKPVAEFVLYCLKGTALQLNSTR